MIWAKRRFEGVDYVPYANRLEQLVRSGPANASRYAEFIMVSTETDTPLVSDYYVGLPDKTFSRMFDGFDPVAEGDMPKVIDTCHFADQTKDPWTSRGFTFRHHLRT
jgi:hypothetical protein